MNIEVIRATETWQQTGAYYVRIHGDTFDCIRMEKNLKE